LLFYNEDFTSWHYSVKTQNNRYDTRRCNHGNVQAELEYTSQPVHAGLCSSPEQCKYSTVRFYETGITTWDFVIHYTEKRKGLMINFSRWRSHCFKVHAQYQLRCKSFFSLKYKRDTWTNWWCTVTFTTPRIPSLEDKLTVSHLM